MSTKLSDAIMLGIGTVEHMIAGDMNACALGIALNAVGVPRLVGAEDCHPRYSAASFLWPWTNGEATSRPVPKMQRMVTWQSTIWYAFDQGVMEGRLTIEQLADWIKSVEPECGECNEFVCTCPGFAMCAHCDKRVSLEVAIEHASR